MARRTDIEILRDHLKAIPNQRASRAALSRELGWDKDKLARVIDRATADRRTHIQLGRLASRGVVEVAEGVHR